MKSVVVQFPGSNRDRDMIAALKHVSGHTPQIVWHRETSLPKADLIVVPGGFSYGDYLRPGAIAARSPIIKEIKKASLQGVPVLGVCNGFQILSEAQLLPGILMRNASLKFVCKTVRLEVANNRTFFTSKYRKNQIISCPVAHHDGNYFVDKKTLQQLEDNEQVAFRYADGTNPNGSLNDIAGVLNEQKNVLGLMPHPENLVEKAHGELDGRPLFESLLETLT